MFKRHLGIDSAARRRLTWWEHRAYMRGLIREFAENAELVLATLDAQVGGDEDLGDLGLTLKEV